MAGKRLPLILIPRFSTYAGAGDYATLGMSVTPFEEAVVNVWRGPLLGTGAFINVTFEESADQDEWTQCVGGETFAPNEGVETQKTCTLGKEWFRIRVTLAGVGVVCMSYATGFLIRRQT